MQQEYIGLESISNFEGILSKHKPSHIFLVTGKKSYGKSGAKKIIEQYLKDYNVTHFYDFEVNPKLPDIEKGIQLFKENNCDFVIAVGGGSVIDVAKSVNILAANLGEPIEYVKKGKNIKNKGSPLVAIPTTAGSGSETTHFAVLYMDKTKYSLAHDFILPNYALVDPQFIMSLPSYITACTGIDALSQAIESYWCINSTEESKSYAKEAIKLVMGNLPDTVKNPSKKSREAMARASYLAGKAINISRTTACHAISYPITSYFNVPHGHAVALTLVQMLVYNSQVSDEDILDRRGVTYVQKIIKEITNLIDTESVEEASKKITDLMKEIGLATRLSEIGIETEEDIELIIKEGFNPDRVKNNPRELTENRLNEILHNIR